MYASRDVRPGELLFAVPKRLHACLDTALSDADCGAEFTARLEDGNAVSIFCAYIAKQHLCDDGAFAPYLGTLDLDAPADFVQFWSAAEVELFRGTPAHGRALEARAEAEEAVALALGIASLRTSVQRRLAARGITDCDAGALDDRIADAVRGAHSRVLSRAFDAVHDSGPGPVSSSRCWTCCSMPSRPPSSTPGRSCLRSTAARTLTPALAGQGHARWRVHCAISPLVRS